LLHLHKLYQSCRERSVLAAFLFFRYDFFMRSTIVPVRIGRPDSAYSIAINSGLLSGSGEWAAQCLGGSKGKMLIVSNRKVWDLYGDVVSRSLSRTGFEVSVELVGDGERFKSLRTVEKVLLRLSSDGFTRTDAVLALGGGVVGDFTGFAASTYLRGIAFLQMPTTLLSMIDSSVGGKTGVNSTFGKNLIGTIYQPRGVLIDIDVLRTLPRRELTAGFCEAIKQGAISSEVLLRQTGDFLASYPPSSFSRRFDDREFVRGLCDLLASQVGFKASIVQNDETESISDNTPKSRKILNFGHTFAHALEKASNYRGIKHGEAVGHGIRFAVELSKKLELLGHDEVDLLNDVVHRAGILPAISGIDPSDLLNAFKHDKKQIGNSLHWILLRGIGRPAIVPDTQIPRSAIKSTLRTIIQG
jgi:3-dehydroquinate synthase